MDADAPLGLPLEYIINHVFLPPKLPQLNDTTTEVEVGLTKLFHETLNTFIGLLPEDDQDDLIALPPMLSILLDDGSQGSPIRNLDQKLADMVHGGAYFQICLLLRSFLTDPPRQMCWHFNLLTKMPALYFEGKPKHTLSKPSSSRQLQRLSWVRLEE